MECSYGGGSLAGATLAAQGVVLPVEGVGEPKCYFGGPFFFFFFLRAFVKVKWHNVNFQKVEDVSVK